MTSIGILGDKTRARDLHVLSEWADVRWGVDSLSDVHRQLSREAVDLVVVDASVSFLTPELCALVPEKIGALCAIAETDGMFAWASGIGGIRCVRSVSEVRATVSAESPQIVPLNDPRGHTPDSAHSPRAARVIVVWGPVGAPGITTVAISLATACARSGLKTMLCDLDSRGSSIAIGLGLRDETPGFAAACRLAGRSELESSEINRVSVEASLGNVSFSVLTGLPRATRWAEVDPAKARAVIDELRDMFDVVIIDAGSGIEINEWVDDAPQRDGVARDVLRRADSVIAVGLPDAVGIARLVRGLDDLQEMCSSPIVLLNRVKAGDGSDASDAIRRFTDHTVRFHIPADSRGGIDAAMRRARAQDALWRRVAAGAGVDLRDDTRRRRWRRR